MQPLHPSGARLNLRPELFCSWSYSLLFMTNAFAAGATPNAMKNWIPATRNTHPRIWHLQLIRTCLYFVLHSRRTPFGFPAVSLTH
jgi:hypothetical protein